MDDLGERTRVVTWKITAWWVYIEPRDTHISSSELSTYRQTRQQPCPGKNWPPVFTITPAHVDRLEYFPQHCDRKHLFICFQLQMVTAVPCFPITTKLRPLIQQVYRLLNRTNPSLWIIKLTPYQNTTQSSQSGQTVSTMVNKSVSQRILHNVCPTFKVSSPLLFWDTAVSDIAKSRW